jgi:hypothetical protein
MRKKATITVETERVVVVSRSPRSSEGWCRNCNSKVKRVSVAEAALIAGASERTVFLWAERADIHFIETEEGKAMFCIASLLKQRNLPAR